MKKLGTMAFTVIIIIITVSSNNNINNIKLISFTILVALTISILLINNIPSI